MRVAPYDLAIIGSGGGACAAAIAARRILVLEDVRVSAVGREHDDVVVVAGDREFRAEQLLVATGRRPRTTASGWRPRAWGWGRQAVLPCSMSAAPANTTLQRFGRSPPATFPCHADVSLGRSPLCRLADGQPVAVALLAAAADRREAEVARTLSGWPTLFLAPLAQTSTASIVRGRLATQALGEGACS